MNTVLITGANAGIGYETALELARQGWRVFLACRSELRGKDAEKTIKKETENNEVEFVRLDLSSLKSVRKMAAEFNAKEIALNVLINNAGILPITTGARTEDGFEQCFAVNHLGHFLLTLLLMPSLRRAPSHVVVVSSLTHRTGRIDFDTLEYWTALLDQGHEGPLPLCAPTSPLPSRNHVYTQSKLCNALFANELDRRFSKFGVRASALCPGVVASDILKDANWFVRVVGTKFMRVIGKSVSSGARTSVYVATHAHKEIIGGKFFEDCKAVECGLNAQDEFSARRLWNLSWRLSGAGEAVKDLPSIGEVPPLNPLFRAEEGPNVTLWIKIGACAIAVLAIILYFVVAFNPFTTNS